MWQEIAAVHWSGAHSQSLAGFQQPGVSSLGPTLLSCDQAIEQTSSAVAKAFAFCSSLRSTPRRSEAPTANVSDGPWGAPPAQHRGVSAQLEVGNSQGAPAEGYKNLDGAGKTPTGETLPNTVHCSHPTRFAQNAPFLPRGAENTGPGERFLSSFARDKRH